MTLPNREFRLELFQLIKARFNCEKDKDLSKACRANNCLCKLTVDRLHSVSEDCYKFALAVTAANLVRSSQHKAEVEDKYRLLNSE